MATKDLPDYMRGFDLVEDFGVTAVEAPPKQETPVVDTKAMDNASLEISKVKQDVSSIKSMMNEVMQIVAEKDTITKEITDEDTKAKFKELEKVILPFLYNLSKTTEPYIHWPNRGPIIKAQIDKVLKITRG
jgi:vacuolar-type H+-ATPase subunit I/STV1|tara:strand:- start:295 stop:690 length:396 start_codon:yes stop_codon:yes gene_type:complete